MFEESIAAHSSISDDYTPHYNSRTGRTMWTSKDGRTCYYTTEATKPSATPLNSALVPVSTVIAAAENVAGPEAAILIAPLVC